MLRLTDDVGDAPQAFAEVVVAEGKRDAGVARRSERLSRDDRNLRLLEQQLSELYGRLRAATSDGATEKASEVGVGVERPLWFDARHTIHAAEHLVRRLAPAFERGPHLHNGIERA